MISDWRTHSDRVRRERIPVWRFLHVYSLPSERLPRMPICEIQHRVYHSFSRGTNAWGKAYKVAWFPLTPVPWKKAYKKKYFLPYKTILHLIFSISNFVVVENFQVLNVWIYFYIYFFLLLKVVVGYKMVMFQIP